MAEKFRKEIRWVYNQRMPWLQIMTEARLQKVGRLGRDRASGRQASQIIYPQNWLVGDKCTIYEPTITEQSLFWENECAIYLWVCAADGRRGTSWSSARTPWILPSRNGAASSPSEATRSSWATSSLQHEHFHFLFFESELICGARSTWCQVDQNYIFFSPQ